MSFRPLVRRAVALHLIAACTILAAVILSLFVSAKLPPTALVAGPVAAGLVVLGAMSRRLSAPPTGIALTALLYLGMLVSAVSGQAAYPAAGLCFAAVLIINLAVVVILSPVDLAVDPENDTRNMRAFRTQNSAKTHLAMLATTVGSVGILAYGFEAQTSALGLIGGAVWGLALSFWVSAGTATLSLTTSNAVEGFCALIMQPARAAFSAINGPYVLENTRALSSSTTNVE